MFQEPSRIPPTAPRSRGVATRPQGRIGSEMVQYQPFIDLCSGRRLGAEAVERNFHNGDPRRANGREDAILRLACVEAAEWDCGIIAVNMSSRQLRGGRILEQIGAALEASGLAPERLEIELSETVLTEIDLDTLLTLSIIRDLGPGIVLDDFGTGMASLRMLKRLPLTGLKLDVSLLRDLPDSTEDAAIARAVIAAAHALGLLVSAAGIESDGQREALANFGCDAGQGPLFLDIPRLGRGFAEIGGRRIQPT